MNGGGSGQNEPESKLKEGIFLILSRWSALLFAVDEETAGRGSRGLADKLFSDIFTWFTRKRKEEPLYIDDLEEILHEGATSLLIEFEDDGAEIEEVAEVLMIMHQEWLAGDYSYVEKLRTAPKPPASGQHSFLCQAAGDDNDSSSSDEGDMAVSGGGESDMAVDSPVTMTEPAPPQTDDDGWTVVASSSRRNRGSRN
ncbi:hypothetical protein LINPERHAP1_LOCUS23498 [Linum perenne]